MNISKDDIDYICRHALLPRLKEWQKVLANTDDAVITENAQRNIARIEKLFVGLGWWSE